MIPCHICGKDSLGGFIHGYTPEPDGRKVGLCAAHNTTENKKKAILHWIREHRAEVSRVNNLNEQRSGSEASHMVTVRYMDGGVVTLQCRSWQLIDGALQLTQPDEKLSFIPLQHIRRFEVDGE